MLLVPQEESLATTIDLSNEHPALFRTFADTASTKEGIIHFANQYGTLGSTIDAKGIYENRPWEPGEPSVGDAAMMVLLGLESGEVEDLAEIADVYRSTDRYARSAAKHLIDVIANHDLRTAEPYSVWREELSRMKQAVKLLDKVQSREGNASEALQLRILANSALCGPDLSLVLAKSRKTEKLALHIRPLSMLSLMWVQLALAATGSRQQRQCGGCGRWFEVSSEQGHGKQEYCDEACKARAYRKRKLEALRLFEAGKTVAQIAGELHTSNETVKKWTANAKPRSSKR